VSTKSDVQVLAPESLYLIGVTFSNDGDFIYFVRSERGYAGIHDLYRIPVLGGPEQQLIHDIDSGVSFSPDGKQIAFMRGVSGTGKLEIHIANADGSGDRAVASLPALLARLFLNGVAWSPDGKTIMTPMFRFPENKEFVLTAIGANDGHMNEFLSSATSSGDRRGCRMGSRWWCRCNAPECRRCKREMPRSCGASHFPMAMSGGSRMT
jgi:WD40 repeat protein